MSDFKKYLNCFQFETKLLGNGEIVKFKPIVTGQIKKLLLYENSSDTDTIEDALDELITECVITPGFDVKKLFLQDRFFLLLELRKATKGNIYTFTHLCNNCNSQSVINIDLNKLPVSTLNVTPEVKQSETIKKKTIKKNGSGIEIKNPEDIVQTKIIKKDEWDVIEINENISLRMSIITREIQKNAEIISNSYIGDDTDNEIKKQLLLSEILEALCIKGIIVNNKEENDVSLDDKIFLLNNISPIESEIIDKWFSKYDFGIDFTFDFECVHCKEKEHSNIPLESFFF